MSAQQPEPWYKTNAFIIGLVLAAIGLVFGVIQTNITKDRPSSARAAIVIDQNPTTRDPTLRVTGTGWMGDNSVSLKIDGEKWGHTLVRNGEFSVQETIRLEAPTSSDYSPTGFRDLEVVGDQSGHSVTGKFLYISW